MKRIIALVLATLMLTVVSPVVFAAELDFSGKITSQIGYYKIDENREDLPSYFHGDSTFSLSASLGENLTAGLSLSGLEHIFGEPWTEDISVEDRAQKFLDLESVWLEAKGSIFPGAPAMTTRLGGLNTNYSPYIADLDNAGGVNGISVDNINIGPVSVGAFYGWNNKREDKGAQIRINPNEQVEVKGTVVEADQLYYEVAGKVIPVQNLEFAATYAAGENEENALLVEGQLRVTENTTVRAGYRKVTENFVDTSVYANEDDIPVDNGEEGFSVGATTKQLGFELAGDYHLYSDSVEFSAARGITLAGMNFNTKLEGEYGIEDSEMLALDATIGYAAPNGMTISAGYDFVYEHPTFTAGLSMAF